MNKSLLVRTLLCAIASVALLGSCNNDKTEVAPPAPTPTDKSFTQSFESMAAAQTQGWVFKYQSNDRVFTYPWAVTNAYGGQSGTSALYSYNDYLNNGNSHDVDSSISNWAISPPVWFQNGDSITFYTFSTGQTEPVGIIGGPVPDRLQLRMTRIDSTTNTGTTSSDVGSFVNPLVDVNPLLEGNGYPGTWQKYKAVITGLNQPFLGRFAIRYYVPDFYDNGWGVLVDNVTYTSILHH